MPLDDRTDRSGPGEALRIADDTSLFVLEDAGVVYSGARGELHAFNTEATWIWCALEEGLARAQIAAAYTQAFGGSCEQALRCVEQQIGEWQAAGFLVSAISPTDCSSSGLVDAGSAPISSTGRERSYALLTTTFSVRFATPEQEAWIHPVLSHLESTAPSGTDARFEILHDGGRHVVLEESVSVGECEALDELAPLLKDRIRRRVINRHPYFMQLHAGAVADEKSCILLPGAPGSGKTTLTAGLVRAGYGSLSDEVALLDEDSFEVRAVPLSLTVKPGAVPVLSPDHPELSALPAHLREDGKIVRYLNPPEGSIPPDPARSYPVRALVFPSFRPAEPTSLRAIPKVVALQQLLSECLSMPRALDPDRAAGLVRWIRQVDCFELRSRSLEEAVACVRSVERQTS